MSAPGFVLYGARLRASSQLSVEPSRERTAVGDVGAVAHREATTPSVQKPFVQSKRCGSTNLLVETLFCRALNFDEGTRVTPRASPVALLTPRALDMYPMLTPRALDMSASTEIEYNRPPPAPATPASPTAAPATSQAKVHTHTHTFLCLLVPFYRGLLRVARSGGAGRACASIHPIIIQASGSCHLLATTA